MNSNDSFENYDMFSNKSYSDKKSLFLNLLSMNEMSKPASYFPSVNDPFMHLHSNRATFDKSATNNSSGSKNNNLEEIFKCFICFGRVKNATMCPHCSKLCCGNCIKKWLTEQKSQCPHCRAPLRVSQLVNCRFVTEITSALDNLQIKKEEDDELCQTHKNKLQYYCTTCQVAICSDCAMIGYVHKAHEFEHIGKTYEFHVDKIKKESLGLKNRLKDLTENLTLVQNAISSLKKNKDEKAAEISVILEQMNQKLESELKSKLVVLLSQKTSVSEEIDFLENMKNELEGQIRTSPKNVLIAKSEELIQMLKEINGKPNFKFNPSGINFTFKSELVPEYDSADFVLANYSKVRKTKDIIYSEPLHKNGLVWRLKVYPNGNGVAKGAYLSIFLELVKGFQSSAKYEYRIEMTNAKNPEVSVIREFASDFETGECWGYNRFFKIEFLDKDGYLSDDDSKSKITINYHVRALNYHQKSIDQENYIQQLEQERKEHLERIASLEMRKSLIVSEEVKVQKERQNEPQESMKEYMITHEAKKEVEEEKVSKNEAEKSKKANDPNTSKLPNQEFSINYFTNLETQIESVKYGKESPNEAFNMKSKKNSDKESSALIQISLEKMLKENKQVENKSISKHLLEFQSLNDQKNHFSFDEDEENHENLSESQGESESEGDFADAGEKNVKDSKVEFSANEEEGNNEENEEEFEDNQQNHEQVIENEEIVNPELIFETNRPLFTEDEEELKVNKPEKEPKECIFETGNMEKDANYLFNDDENEKHFISLDSICEKPEVTGKVESSLIFKEKLEKDNKSHIRNLLPNFEIEARKLRDSGFVEEETNVSKRPAAVKVNAGAITLSENLIKKIENIKFFNQKGRKIKSLKEQKENLRAQDNQEGQGDNVQTC